MLVSSLDISIVKWDKSKGHQRIPEKSMGFTILVSKQWAYSTKVSG